MTPRRVLRRIFCQRGEKEHALGPHFIFMALESEQPECIALNGYHKRTRQKSVKVIQGRISIFKT